MAAMVWLLVWLLSAQAGADGVIWALGGAIALSFGIWLATRVGGSAVGRAVSTAVIVGAFAVPVFGTISPPCRIAAIGRAETLSSFVSRAVKRIK